MTLARCRLCDRRRAHRFTYVPGYVCPRCGSLQHLETLGPCGVVARIKPPPKYGRSRKSQPTKPGRRVFAYWEQ